MGLKVMSAFLGRDKKQVPAVIACAGEVRAEVLCLQEVMDFELPHLKENYRFVRFVPMTRFADGNTMGLVTCSNLAVSEIREQYYMGNATELTLFDESTPDQVNNTKRRPLLTCTLLKNGRSYPVGNTHFLYSKEGKFGEQHHSSLRSLTDILKPYEKLALCGAMVMLRDGPLYKEFVQTSGLQDWVPRTIECTLDRKLHKLSALLKSGAMPLVVVDYIFGVGCSQVGTVRQFEGVCDHTPLLAVVQ